MTSSSHFISCVRTNRKLQGMKGMSVRHVFIFSLANESFTFCFFFLFSWFQNFKRHHKPYVSLRIINHFLSDKDQRQENDQKDRRLEMTREKKLMKMSYHAHQKHVLLLTKNRRDDESCVSSPLQRNFPSFSSFCSSLFPFS